MRTKSKPWTDNDVDVLVTMAEAGAQWAAIAAALTRSPVGCQAKWRELRTPEQRALTRVAKIADLNAAATTAAPRARHCDSRDAEIMIARQAPPRLPAQPPRSLTAAVLGDPPPGRSALDQRRAGQ
ncbi:hypothetical protein ACRAVF_33950 (plasmid) [Bradyrhizobium oligotrophicum S58]